MIEENDQVELEQRAEGTLIRKIQWEAAYREMVSEAAEAAEWSEWDKVVADGLEH